MKITIPETEKHWQQNTCHEKPCMLFIGTPPKLSNLNMAWCKNIATLPALSSASSLNIWSQFVVEVEGGRDSLSLTYCLKSFYMKQAGNCLGMFWEGQDPLTSTFCTSLFVHACTWHGMHGI